MTVSFLSASVTLVRNHVEELHAHLLGWYGNQSAAAEC